jgi:hypothetical protein
VVAIEGKPTGEDDVALMRQMLLASPHANPITRRSICAAVRSHTKDIYPKTRVNRQADLVRLILSLAESAV